MQWKILYFQLLIYHLFDFSETPTTAISAGHMGSCCLPPFTEQQTGCYHTGPQDMTWREAEDYCSSLDAHLAKPDTMEVTCIPSTA